jgi:myo-inositol 2-dehydrogenase/D-chiro-inositol 1-dehydrogenase
MTGGLVHCRRPEDPLSAPESPDMKTPTPSTSSDTLSRRSFLEGSVAVAAAAAIPGGAHAAGSDAIRIGLVGCGGRGLGAAMQAVAAAPGVVIAAVGDRFTDQLASATTSLAATCGRQFAPTGLFHGPRAADDVIKAEIDAVILATPPCFRPLELAAAIRHGRHAYAEAPIGTDAAGIAAAAVVVEQGLRRGLSLASGLHLRHHEATRETVAAIADGAIGRVRKATVVQHLGAAWQRPLPPGTSAEDARIRNWITDERLSGGPLLADLVQALDRAAWALGGPTPLDAVASFGPSALPSGTDDRRVPVVRIRFVGGTELEASIVRREGIDTTVIETVTGDAGTADLRAGTLPGRAMRPRAATATGHAACMASFVDSLRAGSRRDDLATACRSTMLAALARAAIAAGGEPVAWSRLWRPAAAATPA